MIASGFGVAIAAAVLAAAPVTATEPSPEGPLRERYDRSVGEQGRYTSGPIGEETRGVVRSVHGSTMILDADAGRTFLVNVAGVPVDVRERLREGLPVAIRGPVTGLQITARSIEMPGVSPEAPAHQTESSARTDRDAPDRSVTGTVVSIEWPKVVVRTAGGALLDVDADELPASAASALIVNEPITIVGDMEGDTLVARAVEPAPRD